LDEGPPARAHRTSVMANLQELRKQIGTRLSQPLVVALRRSPVSPNMLTVAGTAITLVAAWLASDGRFFTAGIVLGVAALCDLTDGALARATGRFSSFGAILDSTSDRVSEALLLGGLSLWFVKTGSMNGALVCYVALVSSFLVSYLRARAGGLGIECSVGLCTRPERAIVFTIGLLTGLVFVAVCIVAFFASVTVIERLIYLWRKGKETGI